MERAEFVSFLIQQEGLPNLVQAIKSYNRRLHGNSAALTTLKTDEGTYEFSMRQLFKMIVSDYFFEIINDFDHNPGWVIIDRKRGESNG